MIDLRIRSTVSQAELQAKVGKVCTPDDYNLLLTRDALVRKPDGGLLCIYRRRAFPPALLEASYPVLHALKSAKGGWTNNRGLASGTPRVRRFAGDRTYTKAVPSGIIGSFEAANPYRFCRLTT
jgi:hypothetical protein